MYQAELQKAQALQMQLEVTQRELARLQPDSDFGKITTVKNPVTQQSLAKDLQRNKPNTKAACEKKRMGNVNKRGKMNT